MPRPREAIVGDLLAAAHDVQAAAHPYDNQQVLVPARLHGRLTTLVRELQGLPTEEPPTT